MTKDLHQILSTYINVWNWSERLAIQNVINFTERKQHYRQRTAGMIKNKENMQQMLSDNEIYASFKSIKGTPQYSHDFMLVVLAKVRQLGPHTFFIIFFRS